MGICLGGLSTGHNVLRHRVFSCKFAAYFQNIFRNSSGRLLLSSLTSGLFSFYIRLIDMWLLADFNLVHSLKSPSKSLFLGRGRWLGGGGEEGGGGIIYHIKLSCFSDSKCFILFRLFHL